jgi:UDP-glucose 4-epimerase
MNILVAGGAGYVGSHTVRQLQKSGYKVVVYDSLVTGNAESVKDSELIVGDICDEVLLKKTLSKFNIDIVMHFAASSLVGESVEKPEKYYQNNVYGSLCLLRAMFAADVRKIVFSSSCAVYGKPSVKHIDESTPLAPANPYGFSKLAVERMLADFANAHGIGSISLRYFNAAGASHDGNIGECHHPETHLIPLVLQVALGQREKIFIFGDDWPTRDGTCIRDFVHVDDIADAHMKALRRVELGVTQAINLGSGDGFSVRQVIEACRKASGHPIPADVSGRRTGDPATLVAQNSLAKEILGWQPTHKGLSAIIASAWNWHSSNPLGFIEKKDP